MSLVIAPMALFRMRIFAMSLDADDNAQRAAVEIRCTSTSSDWLRQRFTMVGTVLSSAMTLSAQL